MLGTDPTTAVHNLLEAEWARWAAATPPYRQAAVSRAADAERLAAW
eukprot:SAG22_NODE_799_length_7128_cov_14.224356_6_plen_46_part_00